MPETQRDPDSNDSRGAAFPLTLVTRPAWVAGRPSTDARWHAEQIAASCATELARVVDRRVALELTDASDAPFAPEFGLVVRIGATEVAILLDRSAARLLADAVSWPAAGVLGCGRPTTAELALIEYLVLRLVERCETLFTRELTLLEFTDRSTLDRTAGDGCELVLKLAGRRGRLRVCRDGEWAAGTAKLPASGCAGVPESPVAVGFALPTVELECSEWAAAEPGDVILLGASKLEDLATTQHLATETGWALAPATLLCDGPRALRVQCGPLAPFALEPPGRDGTHERLVPLLGSGTVSLADWGASRALELVKSAHDPVRFLGEEFAGVSGELVVAGGETGIRLLQC